MKLPLITSEQAVKISLIIAVLADITGHIC